MSVGSESDVTANSEQKEPLPKLGKILGNSAVFIFSVAESEVSRLIGEQRVMTNEELLVRVGTAREEIRHVKHFDYVVVNAKGWKLEDLVKRVESFYRCEKSIEFI